MSCIPLQRNSYPILLTPSFLLNKFTNSENPWNQVFETVVSEKITDCFDTHRWVMLLNENKDVSDDNNYLKYVTKACAPLICRCNHHDYKYPSYCKIFTDNQFIHLNSECDVISCSCEGYNRCPNMYPEKVYFIEQTRYPFIRRNMLCTYGNLYPHFKNSTNRVRFKNLECEHGHCCPLQRLKVLKINEEKKLDNKIISICPYYHPEDSKKEDHEIMMDVINTIYTHYNRGVKQTNGHMRIMWIKRIYDPKTILMYIDKYLALYMSTCDMNLYEALNLHKKYLITKVIKQ
jgi:hypothetical protein